MIRRLIRTLTTTLESKIQKEQEIVRNRFTQEQESTPEYIIDPDDKGSPLGEFGYRVKGPEPTRYGDWERKGRVSDF
jgi:hypothetical protein